MPYLLYLSSTLINALKWYVSHLNRVYLVKQYLPKNLIDVVKGYYKCSKN